MQDLGAAGLSSACVEAADNRPAPVFDIDVSQVPRRDAGMTPYEVMLSRVPGADARRRPPGTRGRDHRDAAEVGPGSRRHRPGDRGRQRPRVRRRQPGRRRAGRAAGGRAPSTVPRPGNRGGSTSCSRAILPRCRSPTAVPTTCSWRSWARPTSPARNRCSGSTTTTCRRTPWWAPGADRGGAARQGLRDGNRADRRRQRPLLLPRPRTRAARSRSPRRAATCPPSARSRSRRQTA